jgi:hypothetical protein
MVRARNISSTLLLLAGIALQGCSGGEHAAKEIAPGAFVLDEPVQLTQGERKESTKCFIDTVNGKKADKRGRWTVKRGEEVVFRGWAFSKDGTQAAKPLFIRVTGAVQVYYAVSGERAVRPDVNKDLNLSPELETGFELRASTAQMAPDLYAIAIVQPVPGQVEDCERPYALIVE